MELAILGENGKAGPVILKEAKRRGLAATAIVRKASTISESIPVIERDVATLTTNDI